MSGAAGSIRAAGRDHKGHTRARVGVTVRARVLRERERAERGRGGLDRLMATGVNEGVTRRLRGVREVPAAPSGGRRGDLAGGAAVSTQL